MDALDGQLTVQVHSLEVWMARNKHILKLGRIGVQLMLDEHWIIDGLIGWLINVGLLGENHNLQEPSRV